MSPLDYVYITILSQMAAAAISQLLLNPHQAMDCVTLSLDERGVIKFISDNAAQRIGLPQVSHLAQKLLLYRIPLDVTKLLYGIIIQTLVAIVSIAYTMYY